eukprot:scaffold24622_cov129-Isochrysis_galbana.AAC.1
MTVIRPGYIFRTHLQIGNMACRRGRNGTSPLGTTALRGALECVKVDDPGHWASHRYRGGRFAP